MTRLPLLLLLGPVALLAAPSPARALPLDPAYAETPTTQSDPVRRRIGALVWPTLAAPALARQGGRLTLIVRGARGPAGEALAVPRRAAWKVHLLRQGRPPARACLVRTVRPTGRGGFLELQVEVPAELARDVYQVRVMGPGIDDGQPNAVRIFGDREPADFRFAVVTDHQLWDPSYRVSGRELNDGRYPRSDSEARNVAVARQGFAELALLDPDFVLHLGDLAFGVDYRPEYDQLHDLLAGSRVAVFAVPGNHDAYADYVVRLRGGALSLLGGALRCRQHVGGELTWEKAWTFVTCVYGDVKHLLYADLRRDGLIDWQRQLGPPAYSFEHGRLRFVGLNTYDGTPQRRHAFSFYLDVFDLKLGVPAVDNHGGTLGEAQLAFVRREAERARARGQTLVVFGHHDPRGNASGTRYHPNEPFPTDPLGLGGHEEWNFDSSAWDSSAGAGAGSAARGGRPRVETAEQHSGTRLLGILAEHGGYYLCGHQHVDGRQVYEPGSRLGPHLVKRRVEVIRTTSASSSLRDGGYWGYRVIQVRGDHLEAVDLAPEHHLGSVPVGNLRLVQAAAESGGVPRPGTLTAAPRELEVSSGLPRSTELVIPWELRATREGHRFRLAPGGEGPGALARPGAGPRVLEVAIEGDRALYRLGLTLPPAPFPPGPGLAIKRVIKAHAARGNTPPTAVIDVMALGAPRTIQDGERYDAWVGQPLLLSAERSTDPQGDRIVGHLWELGEGRTARGPRIAQTFSGPGRRRITLTLIDEAGARSVTVRELEIRHQRLPGCGGCCAPPRSSAEQTVSALVLPLVVVLMVVRRRRR